MTNSAESRFFTLYGKRKSFEIDSGLYPKTHLGFRLGYAYDTSKVFPSMQK